MNQLTKRRYRLVQVIVLTVSIYLLFKFFGREKFTGFDYILMIVLGLSVLIIEINESYQRKNVK